MFIAILKSITILGAPVLAMTWYLFRRLYRSGVLTVGSDYDTVKKDLKKIKKEKSEADDFLHKNWMKFGGGFYGITAATTLIYIEVIDAWRFITDFPGFATMFEGGFISFLVGVLVNQLQNFIQAALWFGYWGDEDANIIIWFGVAYLCYLAGLRLAQRSIAEWQAVLRRTEGV